MRIDRPLLLAAIPYLAVTLFAGSLQPARAGEVSEDLELALIAAGPDDLVPVVVLMQEFPRRGAMLSEVRGMTRETRRDHVVSRMRGLAGRSQRPVHAIIEAAKEETRNVRVLWGVNGVALEATAQVIEDLARLREVQRVQYDGGRGQPAGGDSGLVEFDGLADAPGPASTRGTGPTGGDVSGPNPDATIRGEVTAMGAPQVWDELGYTGAGVIVAVIDTGVYRDTIDIADHIWTNLDEVPDNGLDDDGNGYVDDTWGWDLCEHDNDPQSGNHGTQVAGQVAGDGTDGIVTGMAPDAEILTVGINCYAPDSMGWEASDYAIANGAHVINLSYVWPWTTDLPDFEGWRRQTDTELAAGVIHLSAAGNDGDDPTLAIPYNVSAPANVPPPWLHPDQAIVGGLSSTVAVANIDWYSDTIAVSSSRGPSAWEDIVEYTDPFYWWPLTPEYMDYPYQNGAQTGLIKPDIAAYGNGTTSTCPIDYYCSFSGTSSATPHVTGIVALMLQANPEATPGEIAEALMTTAQHRGDPGKNNVYGTGLVQAYPAVLAVESGVVYFSHAFDDSGGGNGDLMLDPGEQVVMSIMVESRTDDPVSGLEAILSSTTPGVTIHDQYGTFPTLPARGTAQSDAPHFTLSVAPDACTTVVTFDLEVRYEGKVRRSSFQVRVGESEPVVLIDDDFESNLGWTSDPGVSTQGAFVREDPDGVTDSQSRLTNPEDDASEPGSVCWVTGNGELGGKKGPDNNDVDGGQVILLSPPFGLNHMLSLNLTYNDWFYDVNSGNSFRAEASNDGGATWFLAEERIYGYGGWENSAIDLFALLAPTDDMRLRFVVDDDGTDHPVEGAVDDVRVEGIWVNCQTYSPPSMLAPNPVGATLRVESDPLGHAVLSWDAPIVDGSHDAATLYRIQRASSPDGTYDEVGSATETRWVDVDALGAPAPYYYRVLAENSGS